MLKVNNLYLIHGGELSQTQDAARSIWQKCLDSGYTKHEVFEVSSGVDWSELYAAIVARDMFAPLRFIELRLTNTLNKNEQLAFEKILDLPRQDITILVVAPKLLPEVFHQAWFKQIQQHGIIIEAKSIPNYQWPQWLKTRLQHFSLQVSSDVFDLLLLSYEGNLLALDTVLTQLQSVYATKIIDLSMCQPYIINNNILSVFDLSDAILAADNKRISQVMYSLRMNNIEPSIVLWALTRELRLLINLHIEMLRNSAVSDQVLMKKYNIWQNKIAKYKKLVQRNKLVDLNKLINLAHKIDLIIKGQEQGNIFDLLLALSLKVVNGNVTLETT